MCTLSKGGLKHLILRTVFNNMDIITCAIDVVSIMLVVGNEYCMSKGCETIIARSD